MSQTLTQTLNAESNIAVSNLLTNTYNRKKPNKKRMRDETEDNTQQSPTKKRKLGIPPSKIHNHDDDSKQQNQAFGFSSDDDDDDSDHSIQHNPFNKESPSDNEHDDVLNITDTHLNQSTNSLQHDPYWNMMQSINDSKDNLMDIDDDDDDQKNTDNNKDNGLNESSMSIQIDIDESSMFNIDDTKDKKDKKKKKQVRRYQKWQRDQGIICTQAHLSLLVYRARFRTLLCSDCELQARIMSILPLKFHPKPNAFNGIYTEITFEKLRTLLQWFITTFRYDASAKQFELKCRTAKDRIPCGLFQLIEYIEGIGDHLYTKKCSVSHLNMLFLSLLWSFNIPARMVYVLRPISHILNVNKIYDNDYMNTIDRYFVSKPCICQQMDEGIIDDESDIEMDDICNSNNKKENVKDRVNRRKNIGVAWSESDDKYLWNHRDEEVAVLCVYFGRSRTGIRNRLEHILNPETDSYKVLYGDNKIDDDDDKAVKRRGSMDIDDKKKKKKEKRKKTSRRERIKGCKKENTNKKWSVDDDVYLWEYRDDPIHILSNVLNRTKTSIKMRLEALRDRTSKSRERLIKNLPSTSKSKIKPNKKIKINKSRPDFSYLGQNFIYNRKKGSMVQCIEVYVSDRNEWVHVLLDKGRIHIDLSENNLFQCDCDKNTNKIIYAVSVDKFGCICDVTPRYSEIWSVALKHRVMHNIFYNEMLLKWEIENEVISFQYDWQCVMQHKLWQNIVNKDRIQINECIESEPIPKSEGLFRNHPLFVIEKFVKKYEAIYPKDSSQVIGKIKGQNVYPIKNRRDLHTRERWYKLGFIVKDGEEYIKQVKTSHMSKSEEEFTDLFGKWQCVKYIAPNIGPNDTLPTNSRGNIELWSDQHLPKGCIHITQNGAVFAAKRMEIEYAKAMVGFDQRKGRSVPVFDGIVIHKSHEEELCKVIKEMSVKRREREQEKEQKMMCGLWRRLVQGIMVQQQLQSQQREKEANKRIITIKEFNAMTHKDHVEDF